MRAARVSSGLARSARASIRQSQVPVPIKTGCVARKLISHASGRPSIAALPTQGQLPGQNEVRAPPFQAQRRWRSRPRLFSNASFSEGSAPSTSGVPQESDHETFLRQVAAVEPPPMLGTMLQVLKAQGREIMAASDRKKLHPLLIPLARDTESQQVIGLLRWPTRPKSADADSQSLSATWDLPVVCTAGGGLELLAFSAAQYVHRALVDEDVQLGGREGSGPVSRAAAAAGEALYQVGDFQQSGSGRADVFLTTKVGKFPDVMERLAEHHIATKNDETSALITCEWYARMAEDWARPQVFHAEYLARFGRADESRDTARVALCSPWWTLGRPVADVVAMAGFPGKTLQWVRDALKGEEALRNAQAAGQTVDATPASPEQAAADEAEALLDFATVDAQLGDADAWERIRGPLAEKYAAAGWADAAAFVTVADSS